MTQYLVYNNWTEQVRNLNCVQCTLYNVYMYSVHVKRNIQDISMLLHKSYVIIYEIYK